MNGKANDKIKYTTTDIQKYLEGKLSAPEMHALESAALNDEFLADAIEGIELYKTNDLGDFNADAEKIRNLIQNKRKNKYGPVLWKAAAIITIVATIIALTFNQNKSVIKTEVLADKNIESKKEEVLKPSATLTDTVKKENTSGTETVSKSSSERAREIPSPAPVHIEKEKMETDSFLAIVPSMQSKSAPSLIKELDGAAAGVEIKDKNQETTPDISKDDNGRLEEVVVTGYDRSASGKRKAVSDKDIVSENAAKAKPVNGWKDFKKYLQENKRVDSLQENIKGKVTIRFHVDDKGIPHDFSIERSLSPFYDQEAIRLIKEGPRWKLRNSKMANLSVNIDF